MIFFPCFHFHSIHSSPLIFWFSFLFLLKMVIDIDGQFCRKDKQIESINPANGTVNAMVPDSDEADIKIAVSAAKRSLKK